MYDPRNPDHYCLLWELIDAAGRCGRGAENTAIIGLHAFGIRWTTAAMMDLVEQQWFLAAPYPVAA